MRMRTWLTASVLLAGLTIPFTSTAAAMPAECPETAVLQVDGTKGPGTPTSVDPQSPLNRISARYHGQPGTVVIVIDYPGSVAPIQPWGGMFYDESVAIGIGELRKVVQQLETACENTNYVVLGYSQGARIAGDFLAEAETGIYGDFTNRMRGELYSDPRAGIEAYLPSPAEGITFAGPRPAYTMLGVQSICLPGDAVCGYRPGDDPVTALRGYLGQHTAYGR